MPTLDPAVAAPPTCLPTVAAPLGPTLAPADSAPPAMAASRAARHGRPVPPSPPAMVASRASPAPRPPIVAAAPSGAAVVGATAFMAPKEESSRRAVVLDATVFHLQGGGQPADADVISTGGAWFLIEDVRTRDGVVRIEKRRSFTTPQF
ncbi:hypothetical protein ABZP36_033361 [Zizania latifolia]